MIGAHDPIALGPQRQRTTERILAGSAVLLLALAIAVAASRFPPPSLGLIAVGGLGLLGIATLALARYEAAVFLGFLLIGVVKVEPAPTDLVFAVVISIAAVTGRFDPARVPYGIGLALGGFLFLNLLSTIDMVDSAQAASFLSITLYLAVFAIWLCGYLDSEQRARGVVLGYMAIAAASSVLGLLALFGPLPGGAAFLYGDEYGLEGARIEALFKDANVFGPFLVPIALIVLEEIIRPRLLRFAIVLKWAVFVLFTLGVLFSYSRAAWGNLAFGVFAMLIVIAPRRGGGRRAIALLALMLGAGAILITVLTVTGSVDFFDQRAGLQSYDNDRFEAQSTGLTLAREHPLGIGPGQFEAAANYDAHSLYVRTFAEQGVLGLLLIAFLACATLVMAARNALGGVDSFGIGSAALFGAWCGVMLNSFFVDTLHWRHLWVVAALIWAGSLAGRGQSAGFRRALAGRPAEADSAPRR